MAYNLGLRQSLRQARAYVSNEVLYSLRKVLIGSPDTKINGYERVGRVIAATVLLVAWALLGILAVAAMVAPWYWLWRISAGVVLDSTFRREILAIVIASLGLWFLAAEGSPGNGRPKLCAVVVTGAGVVIYYLIRS